LTLEQLGNIEYAEYLFRAEFLAEKQAQAEIEKRARALSEWTSMSAAGSKTSYREYLEFAGLAEPSRQDDQEVKEIVETANRITERLKQRK